MKTIIFSSFFLIASAVLAQNLGQFGHIIDSREVVEYQFENNTQHAEISYHNKSFPGNAFFLVKSGFTTIENTCGNTPSILRIFNNAGELRSTLRYNQTINPNIDASDRYIYFQNDKKNTILDTETLTEQIIPSAQGINVTAHGEPIYFKSEDQQLYTPTNHFDIPFTPHAIELGDNGNIYVFGRKQYGVVDHDQIFFRTYKNGSFFEAKTINGHVFWVEKNHQNGTSFFTLLQIENDEVITLDKQTLHVAALSKDISTHRNSGNSILCPMYPDSNDYPFRIGNSYAEHQRYSGQPYLHPGVDFLGFPQQEIYSPVNGVVKAILTTSGSIHWRLALGLEDIVEEQEGYLFAHLDPSTIPFAVGDSVSAGDYIGSIVTWPTSAFHHLHFARIIHQGAIWDGNWLTRDNVLSDITNFKDESVPVFEPLWNNQTIAFRSEDGMNILEPENLTGSFDIICHAHDLSNDTWRLDVDSLWFELIDVTTNYVVYEQEAFSYDFELDTYFSDGITSMILNTIYSTTGAWQTIGNYNERQFYQQVSRSNGDGIINDQDASVYFDSSNFPDGSYLLRIHAYDAVQNHSFTEIEVIFNNNPSTSINTVNSKLPIVYPSPNTGLFKIKPNGNQILKGEIYNSLGQLITTFDGIQTQEKEIMIQDSKGIYYIRLFGLDNQVILNQKVLVQK